MSHEYHWEPGLKGHYGSDSVTSVISLRVITLNVTCVARGVAGRGRVVVVVAVVHPHRGHHNGANGWLAGLGLRGNTGHPGLAVLIAARHIALLSERTAVVARGARGRGAVHGVTAALLLIIRHALGGHMAENLDRPPALVIKVAAAAWSGPVGTFAG